MARRNRNLCRAIVGVSSPHAAAEWWPSRGRNMAVWRRRKRQVSDSPGPGVGAKKDRLRGPRAATIDTSRSNSGSSARPAEGRGVPQVRLDPRARDAGGSGSAGVARDEAAPPGADATGRPRARPPRASRTGRARRLLQTLLVDRLSFTPFEENGVRGYRFEGQATYGGLRAGLGVATSDGVPEGIGLAWTTEFRRLIQVA
jgi:hypothetical protein